MKVPNDTCGVYMILCKANMKKYIGSSNNIYQRWNSHRSLMKRNIHKNAHLQNSCNKYGINSFEISVLETCDEKDLIERESFWINEYNTFDKKFGYNQEEPSRTQMSEETKEKIRIANLGKKATPEACKNISCGKKKAFIENGVTLKVIESIKNARKNIDKDYLVERNKTKVWTAEMREKLSAAHKGKKKPPRTPAQIENYRKARLRYLERQKQSHNLESSSSGS